MSETSSTTMMTQWGRLLRAILTHGKLGHLLMSKTLFFKNCLLFFHSIFLVQLFSFNCKSLAPKIPRPALQQDKKGEKKR
jgi:hypothetical protein